MLSATAIVSISAQQVQASGSHEMVQMCAKYEWAYTPKGETKKKLGTTKEHCGNKYRVSHDAKGHESSVASQNEACKAAKEELPKLVQGDVWDKEATLCKSYQKKLGK